MNKETQFKFRKKYSEVSSFVGNPVLISLNGMVLKTIRKDTNLGLDIFKSWFMAVYTVTGVWNRLSQIVHLCLGHTGLPYNTSRTI